MFGSRTVAWCLVLLAMFNCNTVAKEYDGGECAGIVDFELADDADVAALDTAVDDALSKRPIYLTYSCASSLRRFYCLQTYSAESEDGSPFCASVCESTLQFECASYFDHFSDATALALQDDLQQCVGGNTNTSDCLVGGTPSSTQAADRPSCPEPFVPTNRDGTYMVEGTGCAASCEKFPTLERWEWDVVYTVYQCSCIAGLAAGVYCTVLFTIKATFLSKQATSWTSIYVLMFSIGCVGASSALFTIAVPSPAAHFCKNSVVVEDDSTECLAQGTVWTWFTLWTSVWMIIQSFELYAKIVKGYSTARLVPYQRTYPVYAIGVPTLLVVCIHLVDGFGFDEDTGMPFCLPSMRSQTWQHVFYYGPQAFFGVVSAIFFAVALHGSTKIINIRRLHHTRQIRSKPSFATVLDGLADERPTSMRGPNVMRFIGMNIQTLTLLAMYTTGVLYFSIWRLVETAARPQREDSLDEWTDCVFRHSTTDPDAGEKECGLTPEHAPPLWGIVIGVLFSCGYGMLPFFSFAYSLHCAPNNVFSLLQDRKNRQNRSDSSIYLDKGLQGVRGARRASSSDLEMVERVDQVVSVSGSEAEVESLAPMPSVRTGSGSTALEHAGRARAASRTTSTGSAGMEFEKSMRIKVNDADVAEVLGSLGAGGFGLVYRVSMLREHGKLAAMKCARFEGRGQLKRADLELCHEARICLSLGRHDHLVSLLYVCRDESLSASDSLQRFLLFYDLVEGPNLKICLEQRASTIFRVTDDAALISERMTRYARQLISALAYMHSKDVIHEDIKPENILVDKRGFIKVADFGLSSQGKRDRKQRGKLMAPLQGFTAAYRSPEIAKHAVQFQATAEQTKPQQSGRYRSARPQARGTKQFTSRVSTKGTGGTATTEITPASSDVWATALTIFEMFMAGNVTWAPHRGETGRRVIEAYEDGAKRGTVWDWDHEQLSKWLGEQRLPVPTVETASSVQSVRQLWMMEAQALEDNLTHAHPGIKRAATIRVRNSLKAALQFPIPTPLLNLLNLCLAPNPNDRPQDGQEMLELFVDERRAIEKLTAITSIETLQPIQSQSYEDDDEDDAEEEKLEIEFSPRASSRVRLQSEGTSMRFGQSDRTQSVRAAHLDGTTSSSYRFSTSTSTLAQNDSSNRHDSSVRSDSSTPNHSSNHHSDTTGPSTAPGGSHRIEMPPARMSVDGPLTPAAVNAQDLAIMYYNLGLAFNAGGDLESAVQCYYEAKFIDPDYAPTYYNLGIAVRAQGLQDAAREYFATALRHDEKDAKAHYNYGMCLYANGDNRASAFHLKRAVELQPHYGQAYYGLAKIAADKANFPKLVRYMKQAISNGVRTPKMYWRLGRALRLTEDINGAIQSYKQALALQKNFVPAHAFLTLEEALGAKRLNIIRVHSMKARSRGRAADQDRTLLACRVLATYGEALAWLARNDNEDADLCFDDAERDTTWCHCMVADLLWTYGEVKQAARAYQRAISRIEHELPSLDPADRPLYDMMHVVINRRLQCTLAGGGAQEEWKRELLFCEEQMPYPSLVL